MKLWKLRRRENHRAAQLLGTLQVRRRISDLDIEGHVSRAAILACSYAATDTFFGCLNQPGAGSVAGVSQLPVEELEEEPLQCRSDTDTHLDPRHGHRRHTVHLLRCYRI